MEKQVAIQRVSFNIQIDGEKYPVKKPNMRMLKEFTKKQKALEKDTDEFAIIESSIEFLSSLGLPVDVVENLDPQMIEEVTQIVTGQKKS